MTEDTNQKTKRNKIIRIWIPGEPSRVTHQSGTRINRYGGTYKTTQLVQWENELRKALEPCKPSIPIAGPVKLTVTWGFGTKNKKLLYCWKTTKPDTDNLMKTLKDVMSHIGFWIDDAQVACEICQKMWVNNPGIRIEIVPLHESIYLGHCLLPCPLPQH